MTAEGAANWVRQKARDFEALGPRILDLQHRAAVYANEAREAGEAEEAARARELVEHIGRLLRAHQGVANKLIVLAGTIPGLTSPATLGLVPIVIPLAMAGAVIALAGAMALIFRRVTAEERAVALLEQGKITAEEAIELAGSLEGGGGLLDGLLGIPRWLMLAAGAYVVWRLVDREA